MQPNDYPPVLDPTLVGTYEAKAYAGGGYVWDAVLEYRVWMHPERGAADCYDGNDYFQAFESYDEALTFSRSVKGAEKPIALILQEEHINETEAGVYEHVTEQRITEWPVEFLSRPRRTSKTIPDFLSPSAPPNRLDIIRGVAKP